MTDTSLISTSLSGGVTNAEAGAIARGVREMAHTIRGLREDLAQLEAARAKWTEYAKSVEVELNDMRLILESRDQDFADLGNRVTELANTSDIAEREVKRFRDALWQIAYNVPEHDAETDSSYEEWARKFASETLNDVAF